MDNIERPHGGDAAPETVGTTLAPGERVTAGGVVESVQRARLRKPIVAFDEIGARRLGLWYWASVRRATRGLVRTRVDAEGVALTLLGVMPLLRFGPAETTVTDARVSCAYPIQGGVLAGTAGGRLEVEQRDGDEPTLAIVVRGYHARLAARLPRVYQRVQAPAHLAVSRRFLQRPARRLAR